MMLNEITGWDYVATILQLPSFLSASSIEHIIY